MKRTPHKFSLGSTLRCKHTGFTGVVIGRSEWLYNCNTYGLKSRQLKDGEPLQTIWFDEDQLEQAIEEPTFKAGKPTGGPTEAVPQTNRQ